MTTLGDVGVEAKKTNLWQYGKLYILVTGAVLFSLVLVAVAMAMYNSSGAIQLDLSRPGYASVQKQVKNEQDIVSFPANGVFDQQSFTDFLKQYDSRSESIQAINGYDKAAVMDDSFNLVQGNN